MPRKAGPDILEGPSNPGFDDDDDSNNDNNDDDNNNNSNSKVRPSMCFAL